MKNLIKIAFAAFITLSLSSCMAYDTGYANTYGDPYYNEGSYYAPQDYYNTGGYYGNDGYYYRNDMNYSYDNGIPYYYQNYNNSRRKVYVEKRSSSQRPANGFRDSPNNNNGTYTNPSNNNSNRNGNSGFRNQGTNNSGQRPQQQTTPRSNSNSGFRNNSTNSTRNKQNTTPATPQNRTQDNSTRSGGGFRK